MTSFPSSYIALLLLAFSTYSLAERLTQPTPAELTTINESISLLQLQLKNLNKERSSTETLLFQSEKLLTILQRDIDAIERKIQDRRQEIATLRSRKKKLTEKKHLEKKRIVKSLRSIYISSGKDQLKLLLNQEDPKTISRQFVYLNYLHKAQLNSIKKFESIIAALAENTEQQSTINKGLLAKMHKLKQKNKNLKKQNTERQKLVDSLSARHKSGGKQLNTLELQRTEIESIFARLKSLNINKMHPFSKMKGSMSWPIKGRLLSNYNHQRSDTNIRWQGILIAASNGLQAKAVHDGRVVFADWLRGYGLLIIVDHGNNYLTLYAHNQSLLKTEGDVVLAGEPITITGQTGGQPSPALYFEVRFNGKPQNPMDWLSHKK